MAENLTESEVMPANNVTRDQLIAFIRSMFAIDGAFTDGTTILVVADKLAVGVIPIAGVSGLQAALDAKLASNAWMTNVAALASETGFVERTAPNAAAIVPVTAYAKTLLDDPDAAATRATLGFSAFFETIFDDATEAAVRTTLGLVIGTNVHAFMAQGAAVADPATAPPGDGVIAALTSSATTVQAEFNALRDQCEILRDALAATNVTLAALRDRFKATGGNALIAD